MLTMYGSMPMVNAASLDKVSDTVSDSDVDATANHTILFNMVNDLAATEVVTVTFHNDFDLSLATVACPEHSTGATSTHAVTCTVDGGQTLLSAGDLTITVSTVDNPGATGFYDVNVATNNALGAESSDTIVYIIDDVTVTASVDATLTFGITALNSGQDVNGDNTTVGTTATTIPFGTLTVDTPAIAGQTLTVSTNATAGYSVTVQQDQNMSSAAGADIDTFVDGTVGAARTWINPAETLDDEDTYGHLGLTSSDSSVDGTDPFGASLYRGFNGTTPVKVMYHNGPSDGTTDHIGSARVAYQIEVTDLQEAGDYESTLTYICTPIF